MLTSSENTTDGSNNQTSSNINDQPMNNTAKIQKDKQPRVKELREFYDGINEHFTLMKNYSDVFIKNNKSTYIESQKQAFR